MAATVSLVQMLAAGVANTDGTPVASGRCRFYQPGTLTPVTVYADSAAATAITPPLILTAGGTGTAYTQQPTRLIVKDSTDTNTLFDGNVNTTRAESEYVTSTSFNGGAETRLQTILDAASTSFGGSAGLWKFKAFSSAVEQNLVDVINGISISVKSCGAVGNGVADDTTAIQAAVTEVVALGGGIVYFPPGTYLTSLAITIGTSGVDLLGSGYQSSIIKATGAAQDAIVFTSVGTSTSPLNRVSRLGFSHSSTTTGSAIKFSNTISIDSINVTTGLFRFGVNAIGGSVVAITNSSISCNSNDASAVSVNAAGTGPSFAIAECVVTGGGAGQAAVLISNGVRNVIVGSVIGGGAAANSDGVKVVAGTVYIAGSTLVSSLTSGSALNVTGGTAITSGSRLDGITHSVNIGASGNAQIAPGQTVTLDVLDSRTGAPIAYSLGSNGAVTPLPFQSDTVRIIATAAITVTISPAAAGAHGQPLTIMCLNNSGGAVTWTFDAQYKTSGAVAPGTGNGISVTFKYDAISTVYREVSRSAAVAI